MVYAVETGIPHTVIADHDMRDIEESWSEKRKEKEMDRNKNHSKWNRQIEESVDASRLVYLHPNFEGVCGLPNAEDEKIDRALEHLTDVDVATIPDPLKYAVSALLTEIKAASEGLSTSDKTA